MKPVMDKREDIEEIVNSAVEKTTKKIFDTAVGTEGKKLSEILKDIKDKPPADKDKKETHTYGEDDFLDCPTCSDHKGHSHKLKSDGKGSLICTGPDCKREYLIIPKTQAEYKCTNCGQEHIKIDTRNKELIKGDKCVNCGKDEFVPIGYKIDKK